MRETMIRALCAAVLSLGFALGAQAQQDAPMLSQIFTTFGLMIL